MISKKGGQKEEINNQKKTPLKTKSPKSGLNNSGNKRNRYKNVNKESVFGNTVTKSPESKRKSIDETEQPRKKKRESNTFSEEEYTPGSLSNLIQVKKYGKVIVPWDSSFGQDKNKATSTKKNKNNDDDNAPTLKINPLFDLSKKNSEGKSVASSGGPETRIFVGNLSADTLKIHIRKLFKKCGRISAIKIKQSKSLKTKSAVVQFETLESCEKALSMDGKEYLGHHIRVNMQKDYKKPATKESVFVGNLTYATEEEELWRAFETCGDLKSVRIVRDARTERGKGYGFVTFKSADSVEEALKLDGQLVFGRQIRVMACDTKVHSLSNNQLVKRRKIQKKLPKVKTTLEPQSPKLFPKENCVFVNGETDGIFTNKKFLKEFESCGKIVSKKISRSKLKKTKGKVLRIIFESAKSAQEALNLDGKTVSGQVLKVIASSSHKNDENKEKFKTKESASLDKSVTKTGSAKKKKNNGQEELTPKIPSGSKKIKSKKMASLNKSVTKTGSAKKKNNKGFEDQPAKGRTSNKFVVEKKVKKKKHSLVKKEPVE